MKQKLTILFLLISLTGFSQLLNQEVGFIGAMGGEVGIHSNQTGIDYNDYADAFFLRTTNELSDSFKYAVNRFYGHIAVRNPDIFDTLDFLHCYALPDTQSAFLDMIHTFDANSIGSPVHTSKQGIQCASGKYVKLNYNPSTQKINWLQNAASIGVYSRTNLGASDQYDIGGKDGSSNEAAIRIRFSSLFYYMVNQSASSNFSNTNTLGLFTAVRSASNAINGYWNNNLLETETDLSSGIPNAMLYLGTLNNNGTPVTQWSTKQYAFDFGGGVLTAAQIDTLKVAMEEFLDYFGTGVIATNYKGWWTSSDNLLANVDYNSTSDTIKTISTNTMKVSSLVNIEKGDYIRLESTSYYITNVSTSDSIVTVDKEITADLGDTIFTSGIDYLRDRTSNINHGISSTVYQPKFNFISDTTSWRFDYSNDYIDITNTSFLDDYWGVWYSKGVYGGADATYPVWVRPIAIYSESQNKTYFTYGNRLNNPTIAYYDYSKKIFSNPVEIGVNPDNDAHKLGSLYIDSDGYIYCFYGSHVSTGQRIKKSHYPYNISTWDSLPFLSQKLSYPQPWELKEDTISLFVRDGATYPAVEVLMKTGNGCNTWPVYDTIIKFSDTDCGIYAASIADTGTFPRKVHIVWSTVNCLGGSWSDRKDVYYAYSDDGGTVWKKKNGTIYSLPINETNAEKIFTSHADSGVWLNDIQLNSSGEPVILFSSGYAASPNDSTTFISDLKVLTYSSGWRVSDIVEHNHMYNTGCLFIQSNSDYRIYFPSTTTQPYQDGGDVEEFKSTNGGLTWSNTKHITSGSEFTHNNMKSVWNHNNNDFIVWSYGNSDITDLVRHVPLYYYSGTETKKIYNYDFVSHGLNITGDVTISVWLKIDALNLGGILTTSGNGEAKDECFAIWCSSTHHLRFIRGNGTTYNYLDMTPDPPVDDWINVTAVSSGDSLFWYKDGVQSGKKQFTITPKYITKPLIGALKTTSSYYTFDGMIKELMIFDRALTSAEVLSLYTNKRIL
jgi:hypothetical protein